MAFTYQHLKSYTKLFFSSNNKSNNVSIQEYQCIFNLHILTFYPFSMFRIKSLKLHHFLQTSFNKYYEKFIKFISTSIFYGYYFLSKLKNPLTVLLYDLETTQRYIVNNLLAAYIKHGRFCCFPKDLGLAICQYRPCLLVWIPGLRDSGTPRF